jgi:hypothetical protein
MELPLPQPFAYHTQLAPLAKVPDVMIRAEL